LTRLRLHALPSHPRFVFCATDIVFGVNWIYSHDAVGDYLAGYTKSGPSGPHPQGSDPDISVARTVAASSCFPPVFSPMRTLLQPNQLTGGRFPPGPERDHFVSSLRLTDGGVYDNMGLEPVWKSHAVVLVSDGGAVFPFQIDTGF